MLPRVRSLEDWRPNLNVDFLLSIGKYLSPVKRKEYTRLLREGIPAPPVIASDHGILKRSAQGATYFQDRRTSRCYDPARWLSSLLRSDPEGYEAVLKGRLAALEVGGLAGPIQGGLNGLVYGRKPIAFPEFLVPQKNKVRVCMDMSRKLRFEDRDRDEFVASYNSSFVGKQTGCSFPSLRDKAALVASHLGGKMLLSDLTAMYNQLPSHRDAAHMKIVPILLPDWKEPRYYVMRAELFGASNAPAHAMSWHLLTVEAISKWARANSLPESLTTSDYLRPESIGLRTEDRHWRDLLPFTHASRKNDCPWVHTRGLTAAMWKTGQHRMPCYTLHIDDLGVVGHETPRDTIRMRDNVLREGYNRGNIVKSTKTSSDPASVLELCGSKIDMRGFLGLSDEKWLKFGSEIVRAYEQRNVKQTLGSLLKVAGYANYVAQHFPRTQIYITALSRFLGKVSTVARDDKRLWRQLKKQFVTVPPVLLVMLHDGFQLAKAQQVVHVRELLATMVDAVVVFSSDASGESEKHDRPPGLGGVCHMTGRTFSTSLPRDHPFRYRHINFIEAFTSLITLDSVTWNVEALRSSQGFPELIIGVITDNMVYLSSCKSFRSRPVMAAILMLVGELCKKRKLVLRFEYANTDVIPADPLSRDNWKDYKSRRAAWPSQAIPDSSEILPVRIDYWTKRILYLEKDYELRLMHTHGTSDCLSWRRFSVRPRRSSSSAETYHD